MYGIHKNSPTNLTSDGESNNSCLTLFSNKNTCGSYFSTYDGYGDSLFDIWMFLPQLY